jgi:hypothetical protein
MNDYDYDSDYSTSDYIDEINESWDLDDENDDEKTFNAFLNSNWDF